MVSAEAPGVGHELQPNSAQIRSVRYVDLDGGELPDPDE
jgi:hypothetical protein